MYTCVIMHKIPSKSKCDILTNLYHPTGVLKTCQMQYKTADLNVKVNNPNLHLIHILLFGSV